MIERFELDRRVDRGLEGAPQRTICSITQLFAAARVAEAEHCDDTRRRVPVAPRVDRDLCTAFSHTTCTLP